MPSKLTSGPPSSQLVNNKRTMVFDQVLDQPKLKRAMKYSQSVLRAASPPAISYRRFQKLSDTNANRKAYKCPGGCVLEVILQQQSNVENCAVDGPVIEHPDTACHSCSRICNEIKANVDHWLSMTNAIREIMVGAWRYRKFNKNHAMMMCTRGIEMLADRTKHANLVTFRAGVRYMSGVRNDGRTYQLIEKYRSHVKNTKEEWEEARKEPDKNFIRALRGDGRLHPLQDAKTLDLEEIVELKVNEARFVDLEYMDLMLGGLYKFFEADAEAEGHLDKDIFQWKGLERAKEFDTLKALEIIPARNWNLW